MRIVAASALVIGLLSPMLLLAVPKHEAASPEKVYAMTYAVADLPVWRTNLKDAPKFSPEVLTKYLRSTVDPNSWNTGGEIRPNQRTASLVIAQSQSNHEKIADALKAFRETDPHEVEEKIAKQ
jgi:beta-mannanase